MRLRRRGRAEVFGFASGSPRERFSRELREYEGELKTLYVLPSCKGSGAGRQLVGAVVRHFADRGVSSMLLWAFAGNRAVRSFYESLGGVPVAEDGFELGGAWLYEVAYGWEDLDALLSRLAGARSRRYRLPGDHSAPAHLAARSSRPEAGRPGDRIDRR